MTFALGLYILSLEPSDFRSGVLVTNDLDLDLETKEKTLNPSSGVDDVEQQ